MKETIQGALQFFGAGILVVAGIWLFTIKDMHYAPDEFVYKMPDQDMLYQCDDPKIVEIVTGAHQNILTRIWASRRELSHIKELSHDESTPSRSCGAKFGKRLVWYSIIERAEHHQFIVGRW